jgi:hypothetical protein
VIRLLFFCSYPPYDFKTSGRASELYIITSSLTVLCNEYNAEASKKKKYLGHNSGVYSAVALFCMCCVACIDDGGFVWSLAVLLGTHSFYIQEAKIAGNEEIL